ncbi:MAG: transporter [Deltaproteobacteria bacterium]|nr:transporter [Deltaproteobacteria bacterium]
MDRERHTVGTARFAFIGFILASGEWTGEAAAAKIEDNSFLIEEAYNQEPGVIQHIQAFQYLPRSSEWAYSFTEEWPVPTDRHQLSVTLPFLDNGVSGAGLGDVLVNYRFQAIGEGGEGQVAFAPRLSAVLPSGDYAAGHGHGGFGAQANLPLSLDLHRWFTVHANAGATYTPRAKFPGRDANDVLDWFGGASAIWTPHDQFNVMLEGLYASIEEAGSGLPRHPARSFTLNPGVRGALNFEAGGLQVVPGVSAPVVFSAGETDAGVLVYLSFEHRLWGEQAGRLNVPSRVRKSRSPHRYPSS